jgi:tetratricopeptide (TPR) repeat protein
MRRRWKIILATAGAILTTGGLFGWWYADRTIFARMAVRDGTNALLNGDHASAEERFSAAIRKFPEGSEGSARAYLWRAEVRLWTGRLDEAFTDADRALQISTSNSRARTVRGQVEYKLGRYEEAKADFDLVRQATPSSVVANYYLGLIAERNGGLDEALFHYQSAVATDGKHARALASMARVHRLKGDPQAADMFRDKAIGIDPKVKLEIE